MRTEVRFVALFLLLALALRPLSAVAACPTEDWAVDVMLADSGVVSTPGDDDGIGGSGWLPGDDDSDDGIGGSGLYGTITGFGSLCLNGRRVPFPASVPVSIDGEPAVVADLSVGQVVRVETVGEPDALAARMIAVEHLLVGPITAVDRDRIDVMGTSVSLTGLPRSAREHALLEVGARVAVSGLRRLDGTIVASRLDAAAPDGADLVRGRRSPGPDGIERLGGVSLLRDDDTRGITEAPGIEASRWRATGRWRADLGRLVVRAFAAFPVADPAARRVDIEGYARVLPGDRLAVEGVVFRVSPSLSADLDGVRVRARGLREDAGRGPLRLRSLQRLREDRMFEGLDWIQRPVSDSEPRTSPRRDRSAADSGRPESVGRPDRPQRPERPDPLRDRLRDRPGPGR